MQGANEIEVENTENFYDILYSGNKNRTIGSTNNNETSSRSHAVLRIILDNKDNNSNDIISGKFILVDLAGSEKTNSNFSTDVVAVDARQRQAQCANAVVLARLCPGHNAASRQETV